MACQVNGPLSLVAKEFTIIGHNDGCMSEIVPDLRLNWRNPVASCSTRKQTDFTAVGGIASQYILQSEHFGAVGQILADCE